MSGATWERATTAATTSHGKSARFMAADLARTAKALAAHPLGPPPG
ncbi:hypothetical protein ACWGIB_13745 [Streptomyces xiamenensis]